MRLDKFLKVSRIIKRRTVAAEACTGGRVDINGRPAKAGAQIKTGDKVTLRFGDRAFSFVVKRVDEVVKKDDCESMYEVLSDET